MKSVRITIWKETLADVLGLRAEHDDVLRDAAGRKKPNRFTVVVKLESGMQMAVCVAEILFWLIVRPDQEKSQRWNYRDRNIWNLPLPRLGEIISQIEPRQIHGVGVGVEKLKPILKKPVRRVGKSERSGVIRHPFVDENGPQRARASIC